MQIIAILSFFLIAVSAILFLLYRRAALGRLEALPGEITLCEERGIGVDEKRIRWYRYGSCIVRLTDRRLVIAQKLPLVEGAHYVRFVIEHGADGPGIDIGGMIRRGYVPARVGRSQVTVVPDGAGVSVTISLIHANGNRYSELSFRSERPGEYARVFPVQ